MQRAVIDKNKLGTAHHLPTQGGRLNQSLVNYHGGIPEFDEHLKTYKKNEIIPEFGFTDYDQVVIFYLYRGTKALGGFPILKKDILEVKALHDQELYIRKDNKLGSALEIISGAMGLVGAAVAITADALTTGNKNKKPTIGSLYEIILKTEKPDPEKIILTCTTKNSSTVNVFIALLTTIRELKPEDSEKKKACYIATVCYGDINAIQVVAFRKFRDTTLSKSYIGRLFIKVYYCLSPRIAHYLRTKKRLNRLIRLLLLDRIYSVVKD
jgi:hypothetical protein